MQAYSIPCLNPVNRAVILLILRAVIAAVAIVAVNSACQSAGFGLSPKACLLAFVVSACILSGRCMAEIDQAGKVATSQPLPEWIAEAEGIESGHVANDELERTLAELYELRTKLQQCSMWSADTEMARRECQRQADEYRCKLELLQSQRREAIATVPAAETKPVSPESLYSQRTAPAVGECVKAIELAQFRAENWKAAAVYSQEMETAASNREAVTIAELLAERELLRKAILKNTKQAAVIAKLRSRLADRRERRRKAIDRALVRETAAASLIPVVHSYGGIDPQSDAFKACYSNRAEAIENGIPGFIIGRRNRKDRTGKALDCLAAELETCGFFHTPEDRHAPEYLLELIRNRTPSAVFDCSATYAMQAEQQQLDAEEQYDDSFNPSEFEAITL